MMKGNMERSLVALLCVTLLCVGGVASPGAALAAHKGHAAHTVVAKKSAKAAKTSSTAVSMEAKSVLVMDAMSGQVVEETNGDAPVGPASLAKIMTLYIIYSTVAKGQLHWDDPVQISEKAWRMEGSKMFTRVGDSIPVKDMVAGIAVASGNDSCVAIAEKLGGTEEGFVEQMNDEAKRMGMLHTHFGSATGLPAPGQMTTARDMAILARALIHDHPEIIPVLSTKTIDHEGIHQRNRNGLLWKDMGVDGVKTGHTEEDGFHLVASALRGGQRFIAVVMGAKNEASREAIAAYSLDSAFRKYATVPVLAGDAQALHAKVWKGLADSVALVPEGSAFVTVPRGKEKDVQVVVDVPEAEAPIAKGAVLGSAQIKLNSGEVLGKVNLVAADNVGEAGFFRRLWDMLVHALSQLFGRLF